MAQDKPTNRQDKQQQQQQGSWQKNQNQNRPNPNEVENPSRRPGQFEDPEADN